MLYCGLLILSLLLAHGDALYLGQPLTSRRRLSEPRACAMPMEPTPELGVQEVCKVVCAGMQHWNDPFPDAGLTRLYNFMTAQGRVALAPPPPKAGLQGGVTLEYFLEEAAGPAIGTFMECTRFGLVGEPTVMPATMTRGGLATQLIEVHNEQVGPAATAEEAAMVALLAVPDAYLEELLAATRDGQPLPAPPPPASAPPANKIPVRARYLFSLEQERRPPHAGCWFIKELYHMEQTKFQELNEGGEEFSGEDSG